MPSVTASKAFAVRPARTTDGNAMAALALQLGYRCTRQEVRKRLGDMKDASLYGVFVAVLPQDEVVGWMGAYVFRSVELDPFAEISGLVVNEKLRSRGIGKALLNAVEDWARSVGCAAISVNSNIIRDRAHHFYVSNKYELVKTQKTFRKSL